MNDLTEFARLTTGTLYFGYLTNTDIVTGARTALINATGRFASNLCRLIAATARSITARTNQVLVTVHSTAKHTLAQVDTTNDHAAVLCFNQASVISAAARTVAAVAAGVGGALIFCVDYATATCTVFAGYKRTVSAVAAGGQPFVCTIYFGTHL